MKRIKLFLTLALVFTAIISPQMSRAQDKKTVKIGFVADISGIGYVFSQSQLAGLQIAVDEINAGGGILGKPVEFVARDAQLKADVGANIARQMILEDKVDFLLGGTSSGVALAISQVALENKVVIAFHTSNSIGLTTTKFNPYIVQLVPNTTIEARAAAQFAAKLPYTKWGAIGPDYAFGRDSFTAFKPALTQANSKASISNEQWPKLGETDLNPFITAIQSGKPEAVYSTLWGDELATFVQQASPLGLFDDSAFIGLFDTDALKLLGNNAPVNGKVYGFARAPFYAIDNPAMQKFVAAHKKLTGTYPSDWAIMIYDSMMTLKAAATKAGTTNGDAVSKALDDLTIDSLRGKITIRACDHMADVGEYVGTLGKDSKYPFAVLTNITYIPAKDVWNSCDEIAKMRSDAAAAATPAK